MKGTLNNNNNDDDDESQTAGLAIIAHDQPSRTCSRTTSGEEKKKKKIDLESFPQELLLKKLASLFDRITQRNDRLNLTRRSTPATPSTILSPRRHTHRHPPPTAEQKKNNTTQQQQQQPRPSQSPTVSHFQRLSHRLYDQLDSSQLSSTSIINTTTTTTNNNNNGNSNSSKQQLSSAALELLSKPSSILTFHAKIVPQISIEAYLLRILKYCPTSNGVFLSSLIYLDRLCRFYHHHQSASSEEEQEEQHRNALHHSPQSCLKKNNAWIHALPSPSDLRLHFVIDSWNVHRFLIASITAASKLLSDVFYTNSRYAKVGGLPLEELEELEVKFLLMSDFRLMISAAEFDDYTERLLGRRGTGSTFSSSVTPSEESTSSVSSWTSSGESSSSESSSDSDSTDREEDIVARPRPAVSSPPDFLPPSSYASSVSSCNSSERSSCSTITPHSPPSNSRPSPPQPVPQPPPVPTTPRSAFLIPASPPL